jgi:glycosyltransferase involved in cell wall biosynthesis
VPVGAPVVGIAARLDPMKGYEVFLRAAALACEAVPELRLVAAGDGPPAYAQALRSLAAELRLGERIVWLGQVANITAFYAAIDVATSSSLFGEGFSNAVAEAMACGVPCVVTDVGDAARVVGPAGTVVPANSPDALAGRQCCRRPPRPARHWAPGPGSGWWTISVSTRWSGPPRQPWLA